MPKEECSVEGFPGGKGRGALSPNREKKSHAHKKRYIYHMA